MDFPGGATTNVHLIGGFSTIYWRIYTEESGITSNPQEGPTNGYTILKHLGRLKHLEALLRNIGCLASCPRRLGLWVFSPTPVFGNLSPVYIKEGDLQTTKISVDTTTLKVSASGSIKCSELIKGLSAEGQSQQTSQSAPQRTPQGQSSARRPDGYSSSVAIYAAFIAAVTGALSLHLVHKHGALPIGSRTLFTPVSHFGYEDARIDSEGLFSSSNLTTLNVQLNGPGTVTVSLQTTDQPGIARLFGPGDDIKDLSRVSPGTDIWLCPNGAIARLAATDEKPPNLPSPGLNISGESVAKRRQWKLDVIQWLKNFGLHVGTTEDEQWVEVEVWEPFFARLAGETARQGDEGQAALPLKRMFWPARFCFRRRISTDESFNSEASLADPLEFAETWLSTAAGLTSQITSQDVPAIEPPSKNEEISPRIDAGDNFESLSRMTQYPEFSSANLVYPTPPEGGPGHAVPNTAAHGVSPNDVNLLSPELPAESKAQKVPELPPKSAVGSGRYDAIDNDDLFGEMNDKDFGSKGVTDADFSFFDEPEAEDMIDTMVVNQPQNLAQVPTTLSPSHDKGGLNVVSPAPVPNDVSVPDEVKPDPQPITSTVTENKASSKDQIGQGASSSASPRPSCQTISPPLSPVDIRKILFSGSRPNPEKGNEHTSPQKGNYQAVDFEKKLGSRDQKYGNMGKFWFSAGKSGNLAAENTSMIPTVGVPNAPRNDSAAKYGQYRESKVAKTVGGDSSDSTDEGSDDDENNDVKKLDFLPALENHQQLKRKRVSSDADMQSVGSPASTAILPNAGVGHKGENTTFLGNFLSNFSDWNYTGYFSISQSRQLPVLLRREEQIPIAQLLADQITQSSLRHTLCEQADLFTLGGAGPSLSEYLEDVSFLGDIQRLNLKGYSSLHEDVMQGSSYAQMTAKDPGRGSIFKLSAPHLRVRRGKGWLEALPPAMSFWDTFGLAPAHGSKDVTAYCVFPGVVRQAADVFLERLGQSYENCHFGAHSRGDSSLGDDHGLKAWGNGSSDYSAMMQSLLAICDNMASELTKGTVSINSNIVLYIVNPFSCAAALADICAAFWNLFQQIAASVGRSHERRVNEVVLQIVPIDFITQRDSMAVATQSDYVNLALEIYNRCRPPNAESCPFQFSPAILLTENLPKSINFRLASDKVSPLQDGRSLHIAYSKSCDQRWVSVAWCDGTGSLQTTMAYCLRYRTRGSARATSEVRNEVWATTKHVLDKFQGRWKVVLASTDPMESEEIEAWANLADQQNKMRPHSLDFTIVSVNTMPDLSLDIPFSGMTAGLLNSQFSSTPVSTPNLNTSMASPDQVWNAPTPHAAFNPSTPTDPSLEPESDVVLADVCDDSWAVILSHRLNISPHITELRPALASGYLLRRKGVSDSDGVFSLTVNILFSQRPAGSHEALLGDVLAMYRDLASLARARGMRSVRENTLPWHIATAFRSQELLSYIF
ncbi:hypothetical protein N7539_000859 [Penicillium diatomitis]|uniref:Mediator of RNA polymerase II transcription subunit 13 n=1 Tax=Penicillium diatomitis TaxID=2819901 RepID=A0A9X0C2K6_9EURO|nr:uncharacterized protein N7539_000859 [Penicillium diatomitis]KAJ5495743.1 hypothetical protein N7539_000859 [Penicillium diatomitis]